MAAARGKARIPKTETTPTGTPRNLEYVRASNLKRAKEIADNKILSKRILKNGGYVGILMLLIGVAIIAFLIVRTDLFTGQKGGQEGKNMIEQGQDSINKAKAVKDMVERNSVNTMKELEN